MIWSFFFSRSYFGAIFTAHFPLPFPMFRFFAKGIVYLLSTVLVLVIVVMGTSLLSTYRELSAYKAKEAELTATLEARKAELRDREEYLRMVLEDPEFIDRVVREKLGFAKPNEKIYHFGQD